MTREIGILTTSGKAYYKLVSEVRRRGLKFISLTPNEFIPFYVRVIITIESERNKIEFSETLIYDELTGPSQVIDDAVQLLRGKKDFREIIIGIDPGKKLGLAVLGDGIILKKMELINIEEKIEEIIHILNQTKAEKKTVKIGNGVKEEQKRLFKLLNEELPNNVIRESVEEDGTTKNIKKEHNHRNDSTDVLSAIKITMRNGHELDRKR
jgi:hypothetical protein